MQPEVDDWDDEDDFVPEEWISLDDALGAMTKRSSYEYDPAKRNLLELIADARFSMRSLQFFQEADVGSITLRDLKPLRIHTAQVEPRGIRRTARCAQEPMALPGSFFSRAERWRIDPDRVDWKAGTLVATRPAQMRVELESSEAHPLTRLVATGVCIQKVDLEAVLVGHSNDMQNKDVKSGEISLPAQLAPSPAGRKKGEDWNYWIAEVVWHLHECGFDSSVTRTDFFKIINHKLLQQHLPTPSEDKVKKAISAIYRRWEQEESKRDA